MRLLTFHSKDTLQLGIHTEAGVIDAARAAGGQEGIPLTMDARFAAGQRR